VAASTVLSVVYDVPQISSLNDPAVVGINGFSHTAGDYALPGKYLVEFFTWMKYIPSSLAKWKRVAEEGNKEFKDMSVRLFRDVGDRIVTCFVFFTLPLADWSSRNKGTNAQVLLGP